ncbi:MAG TPA: 30S ribosomal protein S8 [Patescibacteria group bacterium]|nr:30S ribosomal protein S8 [Patescibacteria group bacterium]
MNHLVSDFIIRIKNAARARRREVELPYSKLCMAIAKVLIKEKYLVGAKEKKDGNKTTIVATLAYDKRLTAFTDVIILSKPSLRVYARAIKPQELQGKGLGVTIVSTSQGVMTGKEAVKKGVGGELLFRIW